MKEDEVTVGMKVLIPTQKTTGYLKFERFKIALDVVNVLNQDHLFVIYKSFNVLDTPVFKLGLRPDSSTDEEVNGCTIGGFNFNAEDLTKWTYFVPQTNKERFEDYKHILETGDSSDPEQCTVSIAGQSLGNTKYDDCENKEELQLIPVSEDAYLIDGTLDGGNADKVAKSTLIDKPGTLIPKMVKLKEKMVEDHNNKGLRFNEGKLDYTLMDLTAFSPMVEVLEFGAKKYSRDNWKAGGEQFSLLKLLGSTIRHLAKLLSGELYDEESKLSHVGHLQCNLMFIGYFWNQHLANKKSKKGSKFLKDLPKQK